MRFEICECLLSWYTMNSPFVLVAVWREFLWGALAGGFGEGMMHPIDTVKTRIQSQAILSGSQVPLHLSLIHI